MILRTKLFKPAPRPSLIARLHLIDRLIEGLGHGAEGFTARLTLVSAPAGSGKSTFVVGWLAQLSQLSEAILTCRKAFDLAARHKWQSIPQMLVQQLKKE